MKTQIPEQLKADVPLTTMGKLLLVTPVVMTVIATLLAGLASSEMTRAQYDRAYAAQLQSKAGDQWNYFQAKNIRSHVYDADAEIASLFAEKGAQAAADFRVKSAQQKKDSEEIQAEVFYVPNCCRITRRVILEEQIRRVDASPNQVIPPIDL